jgi:glutamate-1-semialdehyde 2,1-aminomutase
MVTIGKPIGGGVPGAAYGMSTAVAERVRETIRTEEADTGGIGGTLAGNALSLAAMRATLDQVLTPSAFARAIPLAERWASGVHQVITGLGLPWIVQRLGCRAEYWFRATAPKNGGEAAATADPLLDRYMHLAALNRGILLTPFHNMALIAPEVTEADIDRQRWCFGRAYRHFWDRITLPRVGGWPRTPPAPRGAPPDRRRSSPRRTVRFR